jgi:hypothetical protein
MTVQCAKCGEELMGSVNRCWRCGQEFVARSGDASLPPIRRSPLVAATADVWVAELSGAIPTTVDIPAVTKTVRRGSPFADRGTATLQTINPEPTRCERDATADREARYQKNGGAAAGAVLAIPLGLISLLAAFLFPLAGFPLALLGLGFGVWGLNSRGRALAVAGLLICCLSLAIATFYGSVEIYTNVYGVTPWESDASLP